MKQEYELLTITPSAGLGGSSSPLSLVEKIIKKQGGEIKDKKEWGEKAFTFPIKKQIKGNYTLWEVVLAPQKINALKKEFKIKDEILRARFLRKVVI